MPVCCQGFTITLDLHTPHPYRWMVNLAKGLFANEVQDRLEYVIKNLEQIANLKAPPNRPHLARLSRIFHLLSIEADPLETLSFGLVSHFKGILDLRMAQWNIFTGGPIT